MVESALHHISILEELDFHDIIVSMKASNVDLAIEAYEKAAQAFDYPLHLGITESGTLFAGTIKSAAGLGTILNMGIGNTVRISLSADPVEEVKVARELLKSFGLASNAATLISCPTCGRIEIDLISIANEVEDISPPLKRRLKLPSSVVPLMAQEKHVKQISALRVRKAKDYSLDTEKSSAKFLKRLWLMN